MNAEEAIEISDSSDFESDLESKPALPSRLNSIATIPLRPSLGKRNWLDIPEPPPIRRTKKVSKTARMTAPPRGASMTDHELSATPLPQLTTTQGAPEVDLRVMFTRQGPSPPPKRQRLQFEPAPSQDMRDAPQPALPFPFADRFASEEWPHGVAELRRNYNPSGIVFPYSLHWGMCRCAKLCEPATCRNFRFGNFCSTGCCPYKGRCGNGRQQSEMISLARNARTGDLALVATGKIKAGVMIGEYFGRLKLVPRATMRCAPNSGYRLRMKDHEELPGRVFIDAEKEGSLLRFMNHSCSPSAEFHELSNGHTYTIVAVTKDDVEDGQEITVDYGSNLWFVCRCGTPQCRHRSIQHESDP